MSESPPGRLALATVTFLFTDIVGSTALWEKDGFRMSQALAAHDALARDAVESRRGRLVKTTGDGIHAAFDDALDALAATLDLQQALDDPAATNGVVLRVRSGLHKGFVERRDDDYFGSSVNRAARIMNAAHGGQVLVSQAVADDIRDRVPASVVLRDMGKIRLKDFPKPEHVYEVTHPHLRQHSAALRPLGAVPGDPPHEAMSFVGCSTELAELRRMLAEVRTLTGAGASTESGQHVPSDTSADHPDDMRLTLLLDTCERLLDGWPISWTRAVAKSGSIRAWSSGNRFSGTSSAVARAIE
jgi:class 3 adenylate cyclase